MSGAAITGVGVVCPLGTDLACSVRALLAGESGLIGGDRQAEEWNAAGAGRVALETPDGIDRAEHLLLLAARQALADAGLEDATQRRDVILSLGASKGAMLRLEKALRRPDAVAPPLHCLGSSSVTLALARELGSRGPAMARVAACATGVVNIISATREVASGRAEIAIAGASEASLSSFMHAAFRQMGALFPGSAADPAKAVRPFDESRCGFLLGEGAAVLIIESPERARRRGARIRAVIAGAAELCDAADMVTPQPAGHAMRSAAALALQRAGREARDLGGLWLHGTATRSGDPAEVAAVRETIEAAGRAIPTTAVKGVTGHLLGASGAVETVLAVACLQEGLLPPVANLERPIASGRLQLVRGVPARLGRSSCMVLNAGFGGHACAVLLEGGGAP